MVIRPKHRREQQKRLRITRLLGATAVIAVLSTGLLLWWLAAHKKEPQVAQHQGSQAINSEPAAAEEPPAPAMPQIDLQPVINDWTAKQSASYSIEVYDVAAKKSIGSHQADKVLFAASLYKLFVAYLALEDIENGKQNPNEILIAGNTRKQCIDRMIRESHSPCGEAMMADMSPQQLESRLLAMNITHTTFNGIKTTASDTALILQYIIQKRDLNDEHTAFLRDAMLKQEQKYRNGLAKGMPSATVYSKVGWNEAANYHDVGIIVLPDGREFIIAVLSQGNGSSKPIANFASTIYSALTQ